MSENVRYRTRIGDYEQELEVPVSQFPRENMNKFASFLLNQIKRDLTSEDKKVVKEDEDKEGNDRRK